MLSHPPKLISSTLVYLIPPRRWEFFLSLTRPKTVNVKTQDLVLTGVFFHLCFCSHFANDIRFFGFFRLRVAHHDIPFFFLFCFCVGASRVCWLTGVWWWVGKEERERGGGGEQGDWRRGGGKVSQAKPRGRTWMWSSAYQFTDVPLCSLSLLPWEVRHWYRAS